MCLGEGQDMTARRTRSVEKTLWKTSSWISCNFCEKHLHYRGKYK